MNSEAARQLLLGDGSSRPKLEYFDIQGVAEQVRIALACADVPFDDVRVAFPDWSAKKATTQHGQLPELTLPDGTVATDSLAMLRLAGEADPAGKLYPSDVAGRLKVDQVLGLVGDLSREWSPCLYLGMRPEKFGHPPKAEWSDADAVIERMRTGFLADGLPRFMGYFAALIEGAGGDKFLCGDDLTIADIAAYQTIGYYRRGVADHVPKESLEPYPEVLAWMARVDADPRVAAYKAKK